MTGLFGFFGLDKDTEGEVESSDKGFKSYLESLDVSNTEKFKKQFSDFEEDGTFSTRIGLDTQQILNHYFLQDEMTPARGWQNAEGKYMEQRWNEEKGEWYDIYEQGTDAEYDYKDEQKRLRSIGSDEAENPTRVRAWKYDSMINEQSPGWLDKWDEYYETIIEPLKSTVRGNDADMEAKLMISQLNKSTDADDIIIKQPEYGKIKVVSARRPRNKKGAHIVGQPIIYKFEDGTEWVQPESFSDRHRFSSTENWIGKDANYYEALYGPDGTQIAGGDLSSVGWIKHEGDKGE